MSQLSALLMVSKFILKIQRRHLIIIMSSATAIINSNKTHDKSFEGKNGNKTQPGPCFNGMVMKCVFKNLYLSCPSKALSTNSSCTDLTAKMTKCENEKDKHGKSAENSGEDSDVKGGKGAQKGGKEADKKNKKEQEKGKGNKNEKNGKQENKDNKGKGKDKPTQAPTTKSPAQAIGK